VFPLWTFIAIERYTKMILAWHLGRRTEADTITFTDKLAHATEGNFQVGTLLMSTAIGRRARRSG